MFNTTFSTWGPKSKSMGTKSRVESCPPGWWGAPSLGRKCRYPGQAGPSRHTPSTTVAHLLGVLHLHSLHGHTAGPPWVWSPKRWAPSRGAAAQTTERLRNILVPKPGIPAGDWAAKLLGQVWCWAGTTALLLGGADEGNGEWVRDGLQQEEGTGTGKGTRKQLLPAV